MRSYLAAAVLIATSACHLSAKSEDRDAGPSTNRTYPVTSFDRIEVAGPYDVRVSTNGAPGVTAKGGSALLEETEVKVVDGKLIIAPKERNGVRFNWRSGKATFVVSTAALKGADIAGSGDITVDKVAGDFDGDVAGSGHLTLASVTGGAVNLGIGGSGDVRANGTADSVNLSIAGSGDIDVAGVVAKTADVSIAGSGNVRAHATDTAKISIVGSGDVDIGGGAKCSISKAGSGDVRCH